MGNVGTMITFRLDSGDAQALRPYIKPNFTVKNLVDLDRYNAIVKMQQVGQTLPAFNIRTFPPQSPHEDGDQRRARIRAASREQYARPKEEIDAEINSRFQQSPHSTDEQTDAQTQQTGEVNYLD